MSKTEFFDDARIRGFRVTCQNLSFYGLTKIAIVHKCFLAPKRTEVMRKANSRRSLAQKWVSRKARYKNHRHCSIKVNYAALIFIDADRRRGHDWLFDWRNAFSRGKRCRGERGGGLLDDRVLSIAQPGPTSSDQGAV